MNEVTATPIQRFKLVASAHVFLLKDNQILLARRFQTGFQDGNYSVPAGHLDGGEHPSQAAIREAWEEARVKIHEKDLEFVHATHRITDRESTDFFFVCRKWEGEPSIGEPDKCDNIGWFPLNDLPVNTVPYIKKVLEHFQAHQTFSELTI